MQQHYHGLPAALNVEQSILLAQLLILRGFEQRQEVSCRPAAPAAAGTYARG